MVVGSRRLAQDFAPWQGTPRKAAWLLQLKLFSLGFFKNGFCKVWWL
jgi:hypothetical protein